MTESGYGKGLRYYAIAYAMYKDYQSKLYISIKDRESRLMVQICFTNLLYELVINVFT